MSSGPRLGLFAAAAAALAVVLVLGLVGLPAYGHFHGVVGETLARVTVAQRHATDVITAINFDYRGLDTMGEEFILFAASVGLIVLLREQRGEYARETDSARAGDPRGEAPDPRGERPRDESPLGPPPLALAGRWALAPMLVLGIYVVIHGQLTPGGGFQGGVILAAAVILLAAARAPKALSQLRHGSVAGALEAVGAGGYVLVGLAGLLAGARFLSNVLPLGTTGSLLSSGTITSLSTIVGLEVAGAITAIAAEFAAQERLHEGERPSGAGEDR